MRPPVGLVYDSEGALVLDPDKQVQQSLRWLFDTFRRSGSASATARAARQQGVSFPRRCHTGPRKGELIWGGLRHGQVLSILHNPRYAGAFVYGRHHTRKKVDGRASVHRVPRDQWATLIPGAHAAYLSWEEYEQNQKRLHESAQAIGADRHRREKDAAKGWGCADAAATSGAIQAGAVSRMPREGIEQASPSANAFRVPDRPGRASCWSSIQSGVLEVTRCWQELMAEQPTLRRSQVERSLQESYQQRADESPGWPTHEAEWTTSCALRGSTRLRAPS